MAHPGELVETIASALGVPRQTVIQHDRQLAARGYRRKGGRGRSAVHVTPEDAANLLIAVAAAPVSGPVVKETVGTFEKYASLPAWLPDLMEPGDWSGLKVLSELPKGHSFSRALAALIHGYARGDFANVDLVWRDFPKAADGDPGEVMVAVKLEGPVPKASISIHGRRGWEDLYFDKAELIYHEDIPRALRSLDTFVIQRPLSESGDLSQIRSFSETTLMAVAKLFSGETDAKENR